jgi:NADPH2 dehydrogenase
MPNPTSKLFQPLKVGNANLSHRIVMAPLTRYRNSDTHTPLDFVQTYYADRASTPGTLIISEATGISLSEEGKPNLPGFTTEEEVTAWKKVYAAVHAKGSYMFQQLWALGRSADHEYLASRGFKYVSSSDVPLASSKSTDTALPDNVIKPTPLSEEEIWGKIAEFAEAAKRVVAAGGDGVEIHGAHGYLIDQFTRDSVNKRTDKWGGSVENRSRFLLEVVKAVVAAIGAERTALRMSPFATYQDSVSSDTRAQFTYIIRELKKAGYKLAYISLVEAAGDPNIFLGIKPTAPSSRETLDFLLEEWDNQSPVVIAGGYNSGNAVKAVDEHYSKWDVAIAFGRQFISNPDLVFRVKNGISLSPYNRATFYVPKSTVGYSDYPFSAEYAESQAAAAA